jgi:O-antigen ligase
MAPTYNFLRIVSQKLKQENSHHPLFLPIVLVLCCIPLSYAVNSMALVLFALVTLVTFRRQNVRIDWILMLPVLLYALMALSLLWTVDMEESSRAISKELSLLIVPVCFMIFAAVSAQMRQKIIRYFSFAMTGYCIFYLIKAVVRFALSHDSSVLFYHELVTKDVNAIHVSVYVAIAFFYFLSKARKTLLEIACAAILFVTLFLLSSKNVIGVFILLCGIYYLFFSGISRKAKWASVGVLGILIASLALVPKIRERFKIEIQTATQDSTINNDIGTGGVRNISIRQAWNNNDFTPNDYFAGTPFRVYQLRIFFEMMAEDNAWLTGYGLNASYVKIEKKTLSYNLFAGDEKTAGYQKKNFHNQYVQNFAELGIFGLLLLIAMLAVNLKNGLQQKDFVHISFAVLMISLFLTESFLWRQRGVTFFTMMYCLLNAGMAIKKNKKI